VKFIACRPTVYRWPYRRAASSMASNVLSNLWLSRMVAPEMRERRDGSIIYITSVAAMRATTVLGMYGVTKAAD
jgi:dehydrogenase/reductase SDR family protein 4